MPRQSPFRVVLSKDERQHLESITRQYTSPYCDVMLSVHFVTMTFMSELPAGDTHDVIRHSGQVVAVVVPIEEYQQLRQAMQEQQVNEEFDAARARYLARRRAGRSATCRMRKRAAA